MSDEGWGSVHQSIDPPEERMVIEACPYCGRVLYFHPSDAKVECLHCETIWVKKEAPRP